MKKKECFECGSDAAEEHHVIPESMGGTKTVPLCGKCHDKVHGGYMKRRDDLSELVKAGHARARAAGKSWGFKTASCTADFDKVQELSKQALERIKIEFAESVIDLILELRNQMMSVNDIASELNSRGVKTQRGGAWHAKSVANIFDTLQIPFRDMKLGTVLVYDHKSSTS